MRYRFISFTKKTLWRAAIGLLVGGSVIGAYFLILQSRGNFHEIIPGELYRSAQLSPEQLEAYVSTYKIKTVINLRGSNPDDAWYKNEMAVAAKLNLNHVDYPISRKYTINSKQAQELADIMRDAPKPVLIHCKAGIDRTGFVTAVYLTAVAKQPEENALEQFCLHFGFVALDQVPGYKMFESFNAVKAELL